MQAEFQVLALSSISPQVLSATWMDPVFTAGPAAPQRGCWQDWATLESGLRVVWFSCGVARCRGHTGTCRYECAGAATSAPLVVCFVGTCVIVYKLRVHPKIPDSVKLNNSGHFRVLSVSTKKKKTLLKYKLSGNVFRLYDSDVCLLNAEFGLLVNKDVQ